MPDLATLAERWGMARGDLIAHGGVFNSEYFQLAGSEQKAFANLGAVMWRDYPDTTLRSLPYVDAALAGEIVTGYLRLNDAECKLNRALRHRGWGRSRIDRWPFYQAVEDAKKALEDPKARFAAALSLSIPGLAVASETDSLESMVP